jgi:hypothetical protein
LRSTFTVALQALRWVATYALFYPFTLGCLVVTKLLVLDRLMDFSKLKGDGDTWWVKFANLLVGLVVVGNIVGLASNIATAAFFIRAALSYESALANVAANASFVEDARSRVTEGSRAGAVHIGFETIILILIVICISIVGVACARRIRAALVAVEQSHFVKLTSKFGLPAAPSEASLELSSSSKERIASTGRQMSYQIAGTCTAVFLSFLLRACFTTLFTMCTALQDNISKDLCPSYVNRCSKCYNVYSLIIVWIFYSPEFFFAVVLLSQPVTLLIALWGMTSSTTLSIMQERDLERSRSNDQI